MAKISTDLSLKSQQLALWRRSMGVVALYGVSVYGAGFLIGQIDFISFLLSSLLVFLGVGGQAIAFREKFFYPTFFSMSDQHVQNATVYGMKFQATNASQVLSSTDLTVLIVKAGVVFSAYLILATTIAKGAPASISGAIISGATCILAFNARFVWVPVGFFFMNFMWISVGGNNHVVNTVHVAFAIISFTLFLFYFAKVLRNQETSSSEIGFEYSEVVRDILPSLKKPLAFAIVAYFLIHFLDRPYPSSLDKNKNLSGRGSHSASRKRSTGGTDLKVKSSGTDSSGPNFGGGGTDLSFGNNSSGSQNQSGDGQGQGGSSFPPDSQDLKSPSMESGTSGSDSSESVQSQGGSQGSDGQGASGGQSQGVGAAAGSGSGTSSGGAPGGELGHQKGAQKSGKGIKLSIPKFQFRMNKKIVSIILLLTVVIFVIVILFFRRKKAQAQNELDLTPQQLEAIKNDLQRQINDAHSAIGAEMYSQEVSRHQIIKFYNDLLLINSRGGVSRSINMTPDEYYYHFIARAPRKASSMRLVTDVYSRVYFGNEIPNQQVWLRYCEAVEGSLLT